VSSASNLRSLRDARWRRSQTVLAIRSGGDGALAFCDCAGASSGVTESAKIRGRGWAQAMRGGEWTSFACARSECASHALRCIALKSLDPRLRGDDGLGQARRNSHAVVPAQAGTQGFTEARPRVRTSHWFGTNPRG